MQEAVLSAFSRIKQKRSLHSLSPLRGESSLLLLLNGCAEWSAQNLFAWWVGAILALTAGKCLCSVNGGINHTIPRCLVHGKPRFGDSRTLCIPCYRVDKLYAQILDEIELANELGFSTFFLAEHHFHEYGLVPSPPTLLGAAAERTERT